MHPYRHSLSCAELALPEVQRYRSTSVYYYSYGRLREVFLGIVPRSSHMGLSRLSWATSDSRDMSWLPSKASPSLQFPGWRFLRRDRRVHRRRNAVGLLPRYQKVDIVLARVFHKVRLLSCHSVFHAPFHDDTPNIKHSSSDGLRVTEETSTIIFRPYLIYI